METTAPIIPADSNSIPVGFDVDLVVGFDAGFDVDWMRDRWVVFDVN